MEDASTREARDMRLLRRYRLRGDREAHRELIERFTPLVRSFARKHAGRGEELEDLAQVGMLALVKAIEGFDLARRHRFVAYAVPTITGEMKRHFRDHCWAVQVPRSMKELQARLVQLDGAAEARGLRMSVAEVARELGVSELEVAQAQRARECFSVDSLSYPVGEARELLQTLGAQERGYGWVDEVDALRDAMSVLSDRDRSIVGQRHLEGRLQREIGVSQGISQMQVSRVLEQSAARMREHARAGGDLERTA